MRTTLPVRALGGFLLLLLLGACTPGPAPGGGLPFTTIEQKNDAAYIGQQQYNALDPGFFVFMDAESLGPSAEWFSESARAKLAQVDWNTQFVVAVFQGWQAGGGYHVEIDRVVPEADAVRVYAQFLAPEDIVGAVTSPYQLVAVRRPVSPIQGLPFELVVGDRVIPLSETPIPEEH